MKPYTFEIIREQASKDIPGWRLGIMDADGTVIASSVVHYRPTAIKWAEKCEHEWDFDMPAAREAIDAAFFGPEKGKAVPKRYTFAAAPSAVEGFVAMAVVAEDGTSVAMSGVRDRDYAEQWAAEMTVRYPLNADQVEAELDKAFAAIKPIDAEYIEDGGTAFPCSHGTEHFGPGISARDLFAAMSMMGMRACEHHHEYGKSADLAAQAYADADAMIAQRSK